MRAAPRRAQGDHIEAILDMVTFAGRSLPLLAAISSGPRYFYPSKPNKYAV